MKKKFLFSYNSPPELKIELSIYYSNVDGEGRTGLYYNVRYLSGTPPFTGTVTLTASDGSSSRRTVSGSYIGDYSRNIIYLYSFNHGTTRGTASVSDASGQTVTATDSYTPNS